jgi:hypothetical protein
MADWHTLKKFEVYCHQRDTTPESANSNKNKGAKLPFLSAVGCHTVPDWMGSHALFKGEETL